MGSTPIRVIKKKLNATTAFSFLAFRGHCEGSWVFELSTRGN